MDYYIYQLSNPLKADEPFYVGMARCTKASPLGFRPNRHLTEARRYSEDGHASRGANLRKLRTILLIEQAGHVVTISYLYSNLTKEDAITREVETIAKIGRLDLGTGPLTNLTGGGDGGMNMSHESIQKGVETRRLLPNRLKGRNLGQYSEERRKAISEGVKRSFANGRAPVKSNLGKNTPQETKDKISASLKGRPSPMKGKTSKFKGTKRGPMSEESKSKMRGRVPANKGIQSPNKGKTYEELYGPEKAAELREARRQANIKRWDKLRNTSPLD
jgi:hypothetical protein